jgi:D-arabinose 1-dehydrogenase-like Zn-dependent alcohol dehydrogenase
LKTRLFYTDGNRTLHEQEWDKPEIKDNEIEVKSVFTGVCRSDIDMHMGTFQLLPKHIQGHESVGIVTKVGRLIFRKAIMSQPEVNLYLQITTIAQRACLQ